MNIAKEEFLALVEQMLNYHKSDLSDSYHSYNYGVSEHAFDLVAEDLWEALIHDKEGTQ